MDETESKTKGKSFNMGANSAYEQRIKKFDALYKQYKRHPGSEFRFVYADLKSRVHLGGEYVIVSPAIDQNGQPLDPKYCAVFKRNFKLK